jgi:hypothetical protein
MDNLEIMMYLLFFVPNILIGFLIAMAFWDKLFPPQRGSWQPPSTPTPPVTMIDGTPETYPGEQYDQIMGDLIYYPPDGSKAGGHGKSP